MVGIGLESGQRPPDAPFAGGFYGNAQKTAFPSRPYHNYRRPARGRRIDKQLGIQLMDLENLEQIYPVFGVCSPFSKMLLKSLIQLQLLYRAINGQNIVYIRLLLLHTAALLSY